MSVDARHDAVAALRRVPTLTEVLEIPELSLAESVEDTAAPEPAPDAVPPAELAPPVQALVPPLLSLDAADEERIAARVLADLQRRADQMLEYRLREALAPLLDRVAAQLIEEARGELSRTLRDVVARAVSQEAARLRRQG